MENLYFMIRLLKSCRLKYPSWFKINLKNCWRWKPFHLSGGKNLDRFDNWLYHNRLVQIDQLDRKETLETISMNRINFTYSSSRNKYEWFRFILWFPKSLFYRVDQIEPVGSGTTCYHKSPDFRPPKDEKVNFHLQQKF